MLRAACAERVEAGVLVEAQFEDLFAEADSGIVLQGLLDEPVGEVLGEDLWKAGDVVNVLFGIQGRELPAEDFERVNELDAHLPQARVESSEESGGPGSNDREIDDGRSLLSLLRGLNASRHGGVGVHSRGFYEGGRPCGRSFATFRPRLIRLCQIKSYGVERKPVFPNAIAGRKPAKVGAAFPPRGTLRSTWNARGHGPTRQSRRPAGPSG